MTAAELTTRTKRCPCCELTLPAARFSVRANGRYLQSWCRDCTAAFRREAQPRYRENHRSRRMQRMYGVTEAEFEAQLAAQGGVCAICGSSERDHFGRMHLDHDHETGRFRGVLCFRCNHMLGKALDDPDRLARAAEYLREGGVR